MPLSKKQPKIRLGEALGNRFVLVDNRESLAPLDLTTLTQLAIDQVIEILPEQLNFYNQDGSLAEACGNGVRCAALWLFEQERKSIWNFETAGGFVTVDVQNMDRIAATLPKPSLAQRITPNNLALPTLRYEPMHVIIGNPHLVLWVDNNQALDLSSWGPRLENAFPGRINVSFAAQQLDRTISLRVWERGVGATQACGTGACATHISAHLLGLTGATSNIEQPGGHLTVQWTEDSDSLILVGPARLGEILT